MAGVYDQAYKATYQEAHPPALVTLAIVYPFNDGQGVTVTDTGVGNYHGTLVGDDPDGANFWNPYTGP